MKVKSSVVWANLVLRSASGPAEAARAASISETLVLLTVILASNSSISLLIPGYLSPLRALIAA